MPAPVTPAPTADQGPTLDLDAPQLPDAAPDMVEMTPPAPPMARDCVYRSGSFGQTFKELDVGAGDPTRLRFRINDLPDPASIEQATLMFKSFDADHPGQEGLIYVNDAPALDLPADTSWDNTQALSQVDVTGLLRGRSKPRRVWGRPVGAQLLPHRGAEGDSSDITFVRLEPTSP